MQGGSGALLRWCVRGRWIVVAVHGPCLGTSKVPSLAGTVDQEWDENLIGDLWET